MGSNRIKKYLGMAMALVLCLVVPFALAGCGENKEAAIKEALTSEFDALKNPTEENLKEYLGEDLESDSDFQELADYGIDPYELLGHLFKHFDYEIGDITVDGSTATAQVKLTNVDVATVMNEASNEYIASKTQDELMALYAEGEDAIIQDLFKMVYDKIDSTTDTTSTDVTLNLTETDDGWDLDDESQDALVSAAFGGADLSNL